MKKQLLTLTTALLISVLTFAQNVPQGINYQGVARDGNGAILQNHFMSLKASIYSDTVSNTIQWQEVHSVTTNDVGIFTIIIGDGMGLASSVQTAFTNIDWNASTHYIKIELDHGSGFMDYGTTALQSVPYALAAEKADVANAVDWTNINNIPADIADGDQIDDADNNITNELQNLTISGDTLYISNGNSVDLSGYNAGVFATDSNVTSNANGDYTNDDFVFGSPTLDYTTEINRMFFDKSKGAFRVGYTSHNYWDEDSLGSYSFATGANTKAKGFYSTAMGFFTEATGTYSIAMGKNTKAEGINSIAMGRNTEATGYASTAMGQSTVASGFFSTAMGYNTDATGSYSTAMGYNTDATGFYSTAMGSITEASGSNSTAMGWNTEASGTYSTAMGSSVTASGTGELYNSGNVKGLSFVSTSDKRVKQNISPFSGALSKVMLLSPKTYFYNTVEFPRFEAEKDKPQIGFIAQEVEAIFPEMVTTDGDEVGLKGVRYGQLTAVLVQAIKEQQEMIKELQERINQLEKK